MALEPDHEIIARFADQLSERYRHVVSEQDAAWSNRRSSPRRLSSAELGVATVCDGDKPSEATFYPVQCRDLRSLGFSFWADTVPEIEEFVVKFKLSSGDIFVRAKAVHVTRHHTSSGIRFIIGCVFKERFGS